jgi:hypothetical protein
MTIQYIEKYKESNSFMFDTEVFKILKQINTIQFVINQMFIELSSFKVNCVNINTDIEKYHHNCKVEEKKQIKYRNGSLLNFKILAESDDEEEEVIEDKNILKSVNLTTYRVWKE